MAVFAKNLVLFQLQGAGLSGPDVHQLAILDTGVDFAFDVAVITMHEGGLVFLDGLLLEILLHVIDEPFQL